MEQKREKKMNESNKKKNSAKLFGSIEYPYYF